MIRIKIIGTRIDATDMVRVSCADVTHQRARRPPPLCSLPLELSRKTIWGSCRRDDDDDVVVVGGIEWAIL